MTSVATLITAKSADTLRAELLAALVAAGFPVASWQPGAVPRSLVYADATALARLHSVVAELAMAAFLDDATGDWLSLFAASRFQVARTAAVDRGQGRGDRRVGRGPVHDRRRGAPGDRWGAPVALDEQHQRHHLERGHRHLHRARGSPRRGVARSARSAPWPS